MIYYLILCRSLTYTQRSAAVLERAGVSAYITRAPKSIVGDGCGYGVKIAQRGLTDALAALRQAKLPPRRVLLLAPDGSYQEVRL